MISRDLVAQSTRTRQLLLWLSHSMPNDSLQAIIRGSPPLNMLEARVLLSRDGSRSLSSVPRQLWRLRPIMRRFHEYLEMRGLLITMCSGQQGLGY